MSNKFAVGDVIRVNTTDLRVNGKTGVIVGYEPNADCPYIVEFDGGISKSKFASLDYEWAFIESELTLVAAPPASPPDAGYAPHIAELRADLDAYPNAYTREVHTKTLRALLDAMNILQSELLVVQAANRVNAERGNEFEAENERLQAQNAALAAQWEGRRARIIRLRRALKDIEKTSGDGRTVLDAKDALAEDDTLAASQRPPAKAGGLQIT